METAIFAFIALGASIALVTALLTLSGAVALYALSIFGLVTFTWAKAFWLGVLLSVARSLFAASRSK